MSCQCNFFFLFNINTIPTLNEQLERITIIKHSRSGKDVRPVSVHGTQNTLNLDLMLTFTISGFTVTEKG